MLTRATVCLLALVQVWAVVDGQYVNDFGQDARFECPANQIMSFIGSIHNNGHEDRRWQFRCRAAPSTTTGCYWTNYLNAFDQQLLHTCPGDEVLNGMMSYHNNHHQDRRFKIQCCRVDNKSTRNCRVTGFVNNWDQEMSFYVPDGRVIKGVYSVHYNRAEDRRWKFHLCDLA